MLPGRDLLPHLDMSWPLLLIVSAALLVSSAAASRGGHGDCSVVKSQTGLLARLPALGPKSKRLYLLRHGQTDWNAAGLMQGGGFDIALNGHGLKQARAAAEELAGAPLDVIASSHLSRSRVTADALVPAHPTAARLVSEGLGEMRFGVFEGKCIKGDGVDAAVLAEYEATKAAMAADPDHKWPGKDGESPREVAARGRGALEEILAAHPDARHLAVVAHGRTNKIMLAALQWGGGGEHLARHGSIEQGNTCINVLDFDERGKWRVVVLNYDAHTASL